MAMGDVVLRAEFMTESVTGAVGRTVNDVVHEFSRQSSRNKRSRRRKSLLSSG